MDFIYNCYLASKQAALDGGNYLLIGSVLMNLLFFLFSFWRYVSPEANWSHIHICSWMLC